MMNKVQGLNVEIKWKREVTVQIKENYRDIVDYFAGKYNEDQENRNKMEKIIKQFDEDITQFYLTFLSLIQVWKLYWYMSPLHRPIQQLFTYISPIDFPHLTRIVINESNIYSIEPIAYLNSPGLRQIDIEQNYITSLKPLRKINFSQLIVLKFYYNNFNHGEYQSISRTQWKKFHSTGLYHFWKEIFYGQYFKFLPNLLKKIYVERQKGQSLRNQKVIEKLKDKFIVEEFYVHFSKF